MRYSQIRAFHNVAVHGGFNAAAKALRVSQPAISYQVKALEEAFGVTLLERQARTTILTPAGRQLLEITSRLFSIQDEAEQLLRSLGDSGLDRLRLGSDAPYSVGRIAAAFGHENPGIPVSLTMGTAEEAQRQLLDETIDAAILVRETGSEDLLRIPYARHRIVLLVGLGHTWAKRDRVRLSELQGQAMALRDPAYSLTSLTFARALADAGVTPEIAIQVNNREHLREAVAAGAGIGVGVDSDTDADLRLRRVEISDASLSISDALVCKKVRAEEPAIKAFFQLALRRGGLEAAPPA